MVTSSHIDYFLILHESAIHCLSCLQRCKHRKDEQGIQLFSRIYAQISQDLVEPHLEKVMDGLLSEQEVDYVLGNGAKPAGITSDYRVIPDGKIIFTPENEQL